MNENKTKLRCKWRNRSVENINVVDWNNNIPQWVAILNTFPKKQKKNIVRWEVLQWWEAWNHGLVSPTLNPALQNVVVVVAAAAAAAFSHGV